MILNVIKTGWQGIKVLMHELDGSELVDQGIQSQ